jgi:hypothetical protein
VAEEVEVVEAVAAEVEAEVVAEVVEVEVAAATWSLQSTSRLQCRCRTEGMGPRDEPFPVPLGVHGRFPRGLLLRLTR